MPKVMTYECTECGCEIIISGADKSYLRPIYCCGSEAAKTSPSTHTQPKKTKRQTRAKAMIKAASGTKRKTVKKVSVPRKSSER